MSKAYEAGVTYMSEQDDSWNKIKDIVQFRQALANANYPSPPAYGEDVEYDDFERGAWDEFCRRYDGQKLRRKGK